jgi:hypothetical protein
MVLVPFEYSHDAGVTHSHGLGNGLEGGSVLAHLDYQAVPLGGGGLDLLGRSGRLLG